MSYNALRRTVWLLAAAASALVLSALPAAAQPLDFGGVWDTDFGIVTMTQEGDQVSGSYDYGSGGAIAGTVSDGRLNFRYSETLASGVGWFDLTEDGAAFAGQWRADGSTGWSPWNGQRRATPEAQDLSDFSALYETDYGRLRLTQDGVNVIGRYSGGLLEGTVDDSGRLNFTYQDASGTGQGWFQRIESGLEGMWCAEGNTVWSAWNGWFGTADAGLVYLVVLETQWETSLAEEEYSFGEMLDSYFRRVPSVEVRHRRIADRADFLRAAQEIGLLDEPVIVSLSGHGAGGTFTLDGEITVEDFQTVLASAPNIELLHFSACEMMVEDVPASILRGLPEDREVALSGYATAVDWGGSAVFEFLYFELLLAHRMAPAQAARVVLDELNFADDTATGGSPLGALYFRIMERSELLDPGQPGK